MERDQTRVRRLLAGISLPCFILLSSASVARAQGAAALGNGLTASAIGRGGAIAAERTSVLDAVQGNPAGLVGVETNALEVSAVGLVVSGKFTNAVNDDAKISGLAGALPYGAFARPFGAGKWVASAAVTPEILMRANWRYKDAPGTAGVSYGNQTNETQIIAVRSSLGLAHMFGQQVSVGATLGIVYNENDLHAPYIFQQQPELAGLKVLLRLNTHGYGWNGGAGVQWYPSKRLRAGLAWKSGTTIRTQGDADGSASALFNALGITSDPIYHYHAQVLNHLPQAFDLGVSWRLQPRLRLTAEYDFTAWGQTFQQLPITLSGGTNEVINSVAGNSTIQDAVPLHWSNQNALHVGCESPVREAVTVRAGYSYANNPVPSATLTPVTAAIMKQAVASGIGFRHGHASYDAAYQVQLPSSESVSRSSLQAGEYNDSNVRIWTQSVTVSTRFNF